MDGVGKVREQHRELVAAETRDAVAVTKRECQPGSDLTEQQVAVVVAEGVIDFFEAIEVEEQQADPPPRALSPLDGSGRPSAQQLPVR